MKIITIFGVILLTVLLLGCNQVNESKYNVLSYEIWGYGDYVNLHMNNGDNPNYTIYSLPISITLNGYNENSIDVVFSTLDGSLLNIRVLLNDILMFEEFNVFSINETVVFGELINEK